MAVQRDKGHNTAGKISERWQDRAAAKEQELFGTSALHVIKFKCCNLDGDSSQPPLLMLSSDFCDMDCMELTQKLLLKPMNMMKGIQSYCWEQHRKQVGKTGEKKGRAKRLRKEQSEGGCWWIRKNVVTTMKRTVGQIKLPLVQMLSLCDDCNWNIIYWNFKVCARTIEPVIALGITTLKAIPKVNP